MSWFEDLVADWLTEHYYHPGSFKALLLEHVVGWAARYYTHKEKPGGQHHPPSLYYDWSKVQQNDFLYYIPG